MHRWGWLSLTVGIVLVLVSAGAWVVNWRSEKPTPTRVPPSTVVAERLVPPSLPSLVPTRPTAILPIPAPSDTAGLIAPSATIEGPSATPRQTPTAIVPSDTPTIRPGLYPAWQRFCVGVPIPPPTRYAAFDQLGVGWYLDWQTQLHPSQPNGIEYAQMVRLKGATFQPALEELKTIARSNPGALWLVGNEPDVIWQDNATPEQYATTYYQVYRAIKVADPTAKVAIGGVSQPTPLRFKYLDAILTTYRKQYGMEMPVDVWNVHNFILREERGSWGVDIPPGMPDNRGMLYEVDDSGNLKSFRQQIVDFRHWMVDHGYRDRPLIVSEYGIPMPPDYGFPRERVAGFLTETFDFLLNATDRATGYSSDAYHLVQRWCWFSLADSKYPTGNLVDLDSGRLTWLGEIFAAYVKLHR